MTDLVEYVVSELLSKRLSREKAAALISRSVRASAKGGNRSFIHPLLHSNTSDLTAQRYTSVFDGQEFFLRDHQIGGKKVLPAVAYLEMVRVAVAKAMPPSAAKSAIELRHVVWAHPVVVTRECEVTLTLIPRDGQAGAESLHYEIHSAATDDDASLETVHSRGDVSRVEFEARGKLSIEELQARMDRGRLEAQDLYPMFEKMGVRYGATHRAISAIHRGDRELLAELHLPAAAESTFGEYLLHPSLLDAALQSPQGLVDNLAPQGPLLPFALDCLHVSSACSKNMYAWVRYAPSAMVENAAGRTPALTKLDVDLCDVEGNVCIEMRGLTFRELTSTVYAAPAWQQEELALTVPSDQPDVSQRHIVLCGLEQVSEAEIAAGVANARVVLWRMEPRKSVAQSYQELALACFEQVRRILQERSSDKVLLQLVVADTEQNALLVGLSGLLRTAVIENPRLTGQILLTTPRINAQELLAQLRAEQTVLPEPIVRYSRGGREVLRLQELKVGEQAAEVAFKDDGVYLITGGLGGLGVLFAREILQQAAHARVILTGRSALSAHKREILQSLSERSDAVEYEQLDVTNAQQVRQVIQRIRDEKKQLNGIIHAAGMKADNFILKKTSEEFSAVLEPKVAGTVNLDEASKEIALDFLVLFSAAAVMGNSGQADYAAANGFMDQYASYRNEQLAAGQRHGRTLSINWPLWRDGGMGVDPRTAELLSSSTGMHPMQTDTGVRAFHQSLGLQRSQVLVVEGDTSRLRRALFAPPVIAHAASGSEPADTLAHGPTGPDLQKKTQEYLKKSLSLILKYPVSRIDAQAPFERYGIDSIMTMNLTNELEKTFGSLSKTLLFEHRSIAELAQYFIQSHTAKLAGLFAEASPRQSQSASVTSTPEARPGMPEPTRGPHLRRGGPARFAVSLSETEQSIRSEPIAIVGLSGRYPGALDVEGYWRNLRDGKDCITEVPRERWDWREFYSEDRGKEGHHYSKWGGFIDGVDEFDPRFFGISRREAVFLDPQERLFLQHVWMALEDAGETRSSLQKTHEDDEPGQVGVYAGVMYSEYQLFGAEALARGRRGAVPGSYASIANRVSYVLDLHGPSMTVDTMCSSSLTAIHLACQDLKLGRTDAAIAGGVNVSIHPSKYLVISAGQFISSDGHCQSFGVGGDGYIPAEAVGVVVLKRLSDALRDGNSIYGTILGSAINHGGKTNGYSVPNPKAQAGVIRRVLAESKINPRHVSYIEAHGTGTKLGDPIEIAALCQAFNSRTQDKGFCLIGSAKSNIGHAESAAGIAGLTKVLLQMKHREIAPSLHSSVLNPHIDFERTPFIVNQTLRAWEQPEINGRRLPRVAGLSSFGAGGSNAHLIVQEYVPEVRSTVSAVPDAGVIIPLSARTADQLKQKAGDLKDFLQSAGKDADLSAVAYTLQAGREAMDVRAGLIVHSVQELIEALEAWCNSDGDRSPMGYLGHEIYQGQVKYDSDPIATLSTDPDFQETVKKWFAHGKLSSLLELWVNGLRLDWNPLYGDAKPQRISLPAYPFAREHYWIEREADDRAATVTATETAEESVAAPATQLPALVPVLPALAPVVSTTARDARMPVQLRDLDAVAALPAGNVPIRVAAPERPLPASPIRAVAKSAPRSGELLQQLRNSLAEALYLEPSEIDPGKPFVDLGLDSIVGVEWVKAINKQYGLNVQATRVYDYPNLRDMAAFLAQQLAAHTEAPADVKATVVDTPALEVAQVTGPRAITLTALEDVPVLASPEAPATVLTSPAPLAAEEATPAAPATLHSSPSVAARDSRKIAIVGMSGRYPGASNLGQYWKNLREGKNCVAEVPPSRWDVSRYYDPKPGKPGKIYCKWLGMLDDVECFDPLFFQITPAEAELMDPQHRLFLQESYRAFEDAGYSGSALSSVKCGVYMGIMSNEYALLGYDSASPNMPVTASSFAIGAARIAYFLNLKGPAIPIDTACSSSLVAVHLACQGLLNHETDMALAGGVTLYLIPESYLGMCQAGMLSPDGQCKTFDDSANGFVPGEGVGALVLKRLEDAQRDNDHIYGVILASGINQDGKTNGITAPSVNSQIQLERDLYARHEIDPETIRYVETHGTGTKLGDPIELEALCTVFKEKTAKRNYCALGSVKSNIGHTSAAAGVASIQKVLLSMQHTTLVPTLNVDKENSLFDFAGSPFYISRKAEVWDADPSTARRAAVSSFGFSGTNAHLVIEEYPSAPKGAMRGVSPNEEEAIILSARTAEQLKQKARDLFEYLTQHSAIDLQAVAHTLQTGKDAMRERLGFVVRSAGELLEKLEAYIDRGSIEGSVQGRVRMGAQVNDAEDLRPDIGQWIATRQLNRLLELWIEGAPIDWSELYHGRAPQRVPLPTYPFAKERYWVTAEGDRGAVIEAEVAAAPEAAAKTEVPATIDAQPDAHAIRRTHYRPEWKTADLPLAKEIRPHGPTLVVNATDELFCALSEAAGGTLIRVRFADTFKRHDPSTFSVSPRSEADFRELLQTLEAQGPLPGRVVHCASAGQRCESAGQVGDVLAHGVYALLHLCRALMTHGSLPRCVELLSFFVDHATLDTPLNEAIAGFYKTLAFENPRFHGKVVCLHGERPALVQAGIILDELHAAPQYESEVRYSYRNFARQVRVLEPFAPVAADMAQMPVRHNGVYIVTGGLGGLGLIICEHLVKTFSARLVLLGRSPLQSVQREKLQRLQSYRTEVLYLQADVTNAHDVESAVQVAKAHFAKVNGVIHCAGVNRDAFILKKTAADMAQVLGPKLYGAIHLDAATRAEDLDLFVLFSSIAGVMGNIGQCDYAYGNHFLDAFAELRSHNRRGRTLSINWPYWSEGGMSLSSDDAQRMREKTGVWPLPTSEGIRYWDELIRSDLTQAVALYGHAAKIKAHFGALALVQEHTSPAVQPAHDPKALLEKAENYIKGLIGEHIKLAPERIDAQERFESFGIDSIVINHINARLEQDFAALPKTLLYEYETVEALARYLAQEQGPALRGLFGLDAGSLATQAMEETASSARELAPSLPQLAHKEPIAVIGQHGIYPGSENLRVLWENLRQGKDLVGLVPADRWDCLALYDPDPEQAAQGKIYCKWGGFLRDVDRFDAGFFNISSAEAAVMDPQERLFLQSVWSAFEDAGYTRERLKRQHPKAKSADVGVFVGVTTSTYQFLGAASLPWSIANRVSYFFDFQGPSMPIDTACSSSLVAVDLACESLRKGECQVAVAGGVNLYLHPSKYQSFCQRRMVSADGKTHSFGAGDAGFVPAEGVGALVLKPLTRALADGDRVLGVIRASGYQHNGRSNGYSAPNPNSQTALISHTLAKADLSPESISYVEGHGTGTQQGDSLEILALSNAFRKVTGAKQFCAVGSLKSNMGHAESAAGVAGLSKILLQFKHEKLTPTLHSEVPSPAIDFAASPFYLQHELTQWAPPSGHARRALISSFGSGGVAACVVLEEYWDRSRAVSTPSNSPCVFVLSAKNADRLRAYVEAMRTFITQEEGLGLADLCYTLQTGREAMQERLAIVAGCRAELLNRLSRFEESASSEGVYWNQAGAVDPMVQPVHELPDLHELACRWAAGAKVEWERLYSHGPRRVELPTYPFARERHWVSAASTKPEPTPWLSSGHGGSLHPLIMHNSSTLREVSFSSVLSDTAYYAQDHKVNGQMFFPGSGFVEIAAAAGNMVGEGKVRRIQDVVWIQPLSLQQGPRTIQISLKPTGDDAEYLITSYDDEYEKIVHSEGRLSFESDSETLAEEEQIPVASLQAACVKRLDPADYYALTERGGLLYGPAFRTLQELHLHPSYALSKLAVAHPLPADFDHYLLHPCLFDGALQTVAGLAGGPEPVMPYIPFSIAEVRILRRIPPVCYVYVERVDEGLPVHADVKKFNIKVANERGAVAVRIKDFCVRAFSIKAIETTPA